VEKATGNREFLLAASVIGLIRHHVASTDSGVVLGEAGYIRLGDGQLRALRT
jgi:hypothetical protein